MEEVRSWVFLMVLGLLFFLGCSSNGAPTVTVEATGVKALTWDWSQKESAVQVTATSAKLITNNGVAVMTGATAKAEPVVPGKVTTTWTNLMLRFLAYIAAGVIITLILQALKTRFALHGLKMVAALIVSCLGMGGGITALFKDNGVSSILSNPLLAIAGIGIAFMVAYIVYQIVLKRRA
jgi:hypothetical protein